MCNFAQYSIAEFNGEKIAVCSNDFINLSYFSPSIILLDDSLKEDEKFNYYHLISKGEFIEIGGDLYQNKGVNLNRNTLELEKMSLPKDEIYSTQLGFKSFPFSGKDVITGSQQSSEQLKGKYVLLDFWAIWCSPCRNEIPSLKALYEKTDRDKFEIVGIVGDSSLEGLKKIIEEESINWIQILSTDSNMITQTFGIQEYPTTLLIDPDGVIIGKNLRGKALEDKIFELFNE